ncbi:hypothetical protein TRFO_21514 [Tritrichomonas foetus]|uniref:Uncharacterized protein n=1 Tax=Tritrichomonas foetus TaxID=1144522 RepID=A0A1J4KJM1_9EUKA|nr:hypothetical protein TRFO_21514 [Tritrichomonas foetus]|eukprot:OHT09557.1 hypothetical protein TRFO_21514 [Tritrichomonas foetus]
MLAITPQSLTDQEKNEWEKYLHQRKEEIDSLLKDSTKNSSIRDPNLFSEKLAWFEFLQHRWGFEVNLPHATSNLNYALQCSNFGPDLRGKQSLALIKSNLKLLSPKPSYYVKGGKVQKDFSLPETNYTKFVQYRLNTIRIEKSDLKLSQILPEISREWESLDGEQKKLFSCDNEK